MLKTATQNFHSVVCSHFIYFKMGDCRKNYNESKLKLTTAKTQLTKSLSKFEENCKDLMKDLLRADLPQSSKVRMAEVVMSKLAILSEKRDRLEREGRALLLNMMKICLR